MKKIIFILFIINYTSLIGFAQSGWFWQNPLPTGNYLNLIQFLNPNTGYIASYSGEIIKTSDGGLSWSFLNAGHNNLSNIYFFDAQTGIVRSYDGTFLKTVNGGSNWSYLSTFTSSYFDNLTFINSSTASH